MRRRRVLGTTALAAVITAISGAAPSPAHTGADARGGEPILRAATTAETIAARQRYFGSADVDPATGSVRRDRVILSWVGVTNFAMAIRGHVVLLDAWVPRGGTSGYVPSSPEQLAALSPEAILIGHAHFDHAADAVAIAQASGATIVGNAEQCAAFRERTTSGMPPRCLTALAAGVAPGTTAEVDLLPGVGVRIMKHLHSAVTSPGGDSTGYHMPVTPLPSTTQVEHPPTPQDMIRLFGGLADSEAGTVLYRFEVGDLTLVWHDSSGPLTDNAPSALDALRGLGPVDIHVGAIQGFNQFSNGMRDIRQYIEAIGAPLFVPSHHDDWAAGITTKGENYREPLDTELARIPPERRPQVRFISDPADYVRPEALTFPVAFDAPRLTRRCVGSGRLRVGLRGDLADVREVSYVLGRRRAARRTRAPFHARFARSTLRAQLGRRLTAVITDVDGSRRTARRTIPSCGLRR